MNLTNQILQEHSANNAELIAEFIELNPDKLEELLKIILQGDKLLAQRSAWVLSKFSDDFYSEFIPYLDFILSEIEDAKHVAVSRNFARVFTILTDDNHLVLLTDKQIDEIVEITFSWVIDETQKAAVVVLGMYTLQNLLQKRPWIAPELKLHIVDNISNGLPSFRAAGKKVLKTINLLESKHQ